MDRKTRRIVEEVFGHVAMPGDWPKDRPSDDALHAYVEAALRGEDVVSHFPAVHHYLASIQHKDEHYLALYELLSQAEVSLEIPPVRAEFDFRYLAQNVPTLPTYFVELGRLVIKLSREFIDQATPTPSLQLAHAKSPAEPTLFEQVIADEGTSVKAKLIAKRELPESITCDLAVSIETPQRRWPNLGGIPVEITVDRTTQTQVTNAFGKTLFSAISIDTLASLVITIGPTAELAGQP